MSSTANTARRLIVMRHAKSSWANVGQTDHERPLNARGRGDAPRVADYLSQLGWRPEFILSSDAQRTRETCTLMQTHFESLGSTVPVVFVNALYLAGYAELVDQAAVVDDSVHTLLVVGHNPGWEGVARTLSGQPTTLKTANAVLLEGSGASWQSALRRRDWQWIEQVVAREL